MVLCNIIKDIEKNMFELMMVFYKFCLKCFFINKKWEEIDNESNCNNNEYCSGLCNFYIG